MSDSRRGEALVGSAQFLTYAHSTRAVYWRHEFNTTNATRPCLFSLSFFLFLKAKAAADKKKQDEEARRRKAKAAADKVIPYQ